MPICGMEKPKKGYILHEINLRSANRDQAGISLEHFEQKWGSKYRHALQSWHRNWDDLTAFFDC
jgi:transposase-like protein